MLSIDAFADATFYERVKKMATEHKRKMYIASGAVGGFDILRAAASMSPIMARISGKKSPKAILRTSLYQDGLLDIKEPIQVFEGATVEAIAALPTHVNVAVATVLASAGLENTRINIDVIPNYVGDGHRIRVEGKEVKTDLKIYSETSKIAGWSVVAVLQNIVSPIVF